MAILILIATILLPPLGVAAKHGLSGTTLLNVVLTLLGFIPGVIHGLYVNYAR
ncbi:YqaE/Pmp3 family membrane protein [Qipengyuania vesicularis]|uniref:YqaE/Pmp3 family membrane protein n=1 Tax=Qipengyuania vesicularis TaxID=2867232 RepID=UPI001C888B79|nr:YqaE/Pmp3 family membrane protein [Qipengyuania vesicularis]MBX7526110.1 YqaE/Pmp3 family membrane protein [Qipengyuania vesicularis]